MMGICGLPESLESAEMRGKNMLSACFARGNRSFPIFGDIGVSGLGENGSVYEKCMKVMLLFLLGKSEDLYGDVHNCTKIHTGVCRCMKVGIYL